VTTRDTGSTVDELMAGFATRTGLTSGRAPQRYLWTDAVAVCNYLGLYAETGDAGYRDLALRLIDQVHHVLGRHRPDDPRRGWLSGLEGQAAEQHPTAGGLRIGKELPERPPGAPLDQRLEWDRDGQYFHYLTKWMHALLRTSQVTGDATYQRWALDLAQRAHEAFTYRPPGGGSLRMVWKMSIDLTRPLVPTMGHHDPLDAFITYLALDAASPQEAGEPDLSTAIAEARQMMANRDWATADPLGIGGLLSDAYRLAQLITAHDVPDSGLLPILLESARVGLAAYGRQDPLRLPAAQRLAFRELGLSIGLHAAKRLGTLAQGQSAKFSQSDLVRDRLRALAEYQPLAGQIEAFWLAPANQRASTWTEHPNINAVMLATSLAPGGYQGTEACHSERSAAE
jgi:hypothetical protein